MAIRITVPAGLFKVRATLDQAPAAVKVTVPAGAVRIGITAMPGPKGADGAAGADGADGATGYDFTQASASALWTINHNLGRKPMITLFTPGGQQMMADVLHVSTNQAQVSFAAPQTGSARAI